MLEVAAEEARKHGVIKQGDRVISIAGVPVGEAGTTNLMKLRVIGDILAKGQGIGKNVGFGEAIVVRNAEEALAMDTEGKIIVTYGTDRDM
ncbi:pyruvate kinase alpha/beta domain-containing protein, partial [Halomonas sp. SIMBA_159]